METAARTRRRLTLLQLLGGSTTALQQVLGYTKLSWKNFERSCYMCGNITGYAGIKILLAITVARSDTYRVCAYPERRSKRLKNLAENLIVHHSCKRFTRRRKNRLQITMMTYLLVLIAHPLELLKCSLSNGR